MKVKGTICFTSLGIGLVALTVPTGVGAAETLRQIWSHEITLNRGNQSEIRLDRDGNSVHLWSSQTNALVTKFSGGGGARLWQQELPVNLRRLQIDPAGNPIVAGRIKVTVNGTEQSDLYLAKLSGSSGNVLWDEQRPEHRKHLDAVDLRLDGADPIVLSSPAIPPITNWNTVLTRHAGSDGELLWQKDFLDLPAYGSITVGTNGTMAVAFISNNSSNLHLTKLSSTTGTAIWSVTNAPSTNLLSLGEMAIDHVGNLVLTCTFNERQMHTAKFGSADGTLLWEKTVSTALLKPRPVTYGRQVFALPGGDLLVLGMLASDQGDHANTPYMVRYAAEDGTQLWARRYPFSSSPFLPQDDYPHLTRIILDSADGNIVFGVATGFHSSSSSLSSTIKAASATGEVLWQLTHTNIDYSAFDYQPNPVVRAGVARSNDAAIATLFRGGPELSFVPVTANEYEVRWSGSYLGWTLQRWGGESSARTAQWTTIPGSDAATAVRLHTEQNGAEFFRLVR